MEELIRREMRRAAHRDRRALDQQRPAQLPRPRSRPGRRGARRAPAARPSRSASAARATGTCAVDDGSRIVMRPTQAGLDDGDRSGDGGRARGHRPPDQRARHARADDHPPGRQPDPRPGARPAGSRGAEGADRPHRPARVQAGRSERHPDAAASRPRADRQPDPALCRGRPERAHRRPAPRDHHRRPDRRRRPGLRRADGQPGGHASASTAPAASASPG